MFLRKFSIMERIIDCKKFLSRFFIKKISKLELFTKIHHFKKNKNWSLKIDDDCWKNINFFYQFFDWYSIDFWHNFSSLFRQILSNNRVNNQDGVIVSWFFDQIFKWIFLIIFWGGGGRGEISIKPTNQKTRTIFYLIFFLLSKITEFLEYWTLRLQNSTLIICRQFVRLDKEHFMTAISLFMETLYPKWPFSKTSRFLCAIKTSHSHSTSLLNLEREFNWYKRFI